MKRMLFLALCTTACCLTAHATDGAKVIERGFLYESDVPPTCHAATLAELKDGTMMAAFFGGTYEGHPDSDIWSCNYEKGHWSSPSILADGVYTEYTKGAFEYDALMPKIMDRDSMFRNTSWLQTAKSNGKPLASLKVRKPCYNPVLYRTEDGKIVLDYKIGSNMQDWTGWEIRSSGKGKRWSHPRMLATTEEERHLTLGPIKNKPLVSKGRIIAGSSTEVTYDSWKVHFETSDDDGRTWQKREVDCEGILCIQPALLDMGDGHIRALCRTRNSRIAMTESFDNGTTWTKMQLTSLPNNDSGIDAVTLKDGRHLLISNPNSEPGHRSPLSISISEDGENWRHLIDLEEDDHHEYSYPCIVEASDGLVWVLYTWRRKRIAYAILKIENEP